MTSEYCTRVVYIGTHIPAPSDPQSCPHIILLQTTVQVGQGIQSLTLDGFIATNITCVTGRDFLLVVQIPTRYGPFLQEKGPLVPRIVSFTQVLENIRSKVDGRVALCHAFQECLQGTRMAVALDDMGSTAHERANLIGQRLQKCMYIGKYVCVCVLLVHIEYCYKGLTGIQPAQGERRKVKKTATVGLEPRVYDCSRHKPLSHEATTETSLHNSPFILHPQITMTLDVEMKRTNEVSKT